MLLLPLLIFTSLSAVVRARGTPLSGSCSMPTRASTVTSQDSGTVALELSCSVPSFGCCFFPFFFSVMWRRTFLGLPSPSVPLRERLKSRMQVQFSEFIQVYKDRLVEKFLSDNDHTPSLSSSSSSASSSLSSPPPASAAATKAVAAISTLRFLKQKEHAVTSMQICDAP